MILHIVEAESGEPLPNTKLYLFYLFEDGRGKVVRATTDASGKLGVDMPQKPFHGLNMFVTRDGHVPKVTTWGFGRKMPAEYTMKLERGVPIGGVVVDEARQPIAGAKIEFEPVTMCPPNAQCAGPPAGTLTAFGVSVDLTPWSPGFIVYNYSLARND